MIQITIIISLKLKNLTEYKIQMKVNIKANYNLTINYYINNNLSVSETNFEIIDYRSPKFALCNKHITLIFIKENNKPSFNTSTD